MGINVGVNVRVEAGTEVGVEVGIKVEVEVGMKAGVNVIVAAAATVAAAAGVSVRVTAEVVEAGVVGSMAVAVPRKTMNEGRLNGTIQAETSRRTSRKGKRILMRISTPKQSSETSGIGRGKTRRNADFPFPQS